MSFLKFLFHFTIRVTIIFAFIALIVFLLWGALYLAFLKEA